MKSLVTAVVVTHEAGENLDTVLNAISAQTFAVEKIHTVIGIAGLREIDLAKNADENHWLWILYSDNAPEPDCLEKLLETEEREGLVGLIGPKQVSLDNPRIILQQGLTLTPWGAPFSLVSGELDQSQHDDATDVMAVGTVGALVRMDIWNKTRGINHKMPALAADFDLALRVKLAGARVLVAPSAKVRVAKTKKPNLEKRKAAIALRFAYSPVWLALMFWLFLPAITAVRIAGRLLEKNPDRIPSEIAGGFWGYFTVFARLRARPKTSAAAVRAIRKAFNASWARVRATSSSRVDSEANFQSQPEERNIGFFESGGLIWILLLLGISFRYFPIGEAIVGPGSIPLAKTWADVFSQTGVAWQPLGVGFVGPSDPFNWVLLAIASFTPWLPSLSIGWLLFVAPVIAFVGAWRAMSLVTTRIWVRTFAALAFALWPSVLQARANAELPALIASITLPWLVFAVARAAGLGRSGSARSMRQTWSWVGLSGLLLAVVGTSAPILMIPIFLALAVAAFTRLRRFAYLFWIPLPFFALYTPLAYNLVVARAHPAAVLAEPGIPIGGPSGNLLQIWLPSEANIFGYGFLALGALALAALLTRRWILAAVIWLFVAATLLLQNVYVNTTFAASNLTDLDRVNGSATALGAAVGLLLAALFAIAAEQSSKWPRFALSLLAFVGVITPLTVQIATLQPAYTSTDARVVPWLLDAQNDAGASLRVLNLHTRDGDLIASLQTLSGATMEKSSLSYRFALASMNSDTKAYKQVATLAAHLRAGAADQLQVELSDAHVAYVLVNDASTDGSALASALDSVPQLESAGVTSFGRLWRVTSPISPAPEASASWWSVTRGVQLIILTMFALLAIPTAGRKRSAKESEIFIDGDGDQK